MRLAFDQDIKLAKGDTIIADARNEDGREVVIELTVKAVHVKPKKFMERVEYVTINGSPELRETL